MTQRMLATLVVLQLIAVAAWAGPAEDAVLREAATKLDISAVKSALDKGANPNAVSSDRRPLTPLYALTLGMLVHHDEDANKKALEIAKLLFSSGAKLGVFDLGILFFPISAGNVQLVSLLLDRGVSPTAKVEGYTPSELALKYSQKEIYDLFVSRGGIPVNEERGAQLALVEAASGGDIAGMEGALKAGARIDGADADGRTALINAVRIPTYDRRRAEAVWWLLDKGADPNVKGESGFSGVEGIPLHIFVTMNNYPSKVSLLGPMQEN